MSREPYLAAHDALIAEYIESHPDATWSHAYEATRDDAYGRMQEDLAAGADYARMKTKDRL